MNEQSPPRKLSRSRSDRYVGGVAAGLAAYLRIDPVFVRIAFVASLALGGLGLLAYVVLLAVMPVEGEAAEPMPPIEPRRRNLMIGLAVVVGVVGIATADSGDFAGWLFGFWPGVVFGILFWTAAAIGAIWLLARGAFSRDRDAGDSSPATSEPFPPSDPKPAGPSTEVVTYAESPTQLSTELMETRQMEAGVGEKTTDTPEPPDAPTGPSARPADDGPSTVGKIMVWFAIGLSALVVFCILFVFSAGVTALFGGVPIAALVILLGGGMVFAGVRGRRQLSLWLLTAAIAVTMPMAAVSIADLRIEGSYGDINEAPLSRVDLPGDGFYRMAAGNMTIDLRKFKFDRDLDDVTIAVKSGIGLTSVIVPDDVCVAGQILGKAGVANIRGHQSSGISISQTAPYPRNWRHVAVPRHLIYLDGEFKLGAFEVVDNTQWLRNGQAGSFEDEDDFTPDDREVVAARERATAACAVSGADSAVRPPKKAAR